MRGKSKDEHVYSFSPHALTNHLSKVRVRTIGAALAAGIAGSAMIAIPVFAQTGN